MTLFLGESSPLRLSMLCPKHCEGGAHLDLNMILLFFGWLLTLSGFLLKKGFFSGSSHEACSKASPARTSALLIKPHDDREQHWSLCLLQSCSVVD